MARGTLWRAAKGKWYGSCSLRRPLTFGKKHILLADENKSRRAQEWVLSLQIRRDQILKKMIGPNRFIR